MALFRCGGGGGSELSPEIVTQVNGNFTATEDGLYCCFLDWLAMANYSTFSLESYTNGTIVANANKTYGQQIGGYCNDFVLIIKLTKGQYVNRPISGYANACWSIVRLGDL